MPFIAAGLMDRPITFEKNTPIKNSIGEEVPAWSTLAEDFAQKVDLRAEERFQARAINAEITTIFRIRWRDDILHVHRIVDEDGNIYDIDAITEGRGRHDVLEIRAVAQVN